MGLVGNRLMDGGLSLRLVVRRRCRLEGWRVDVGVRTLDPEIAIGNTMVGRVWMLVRRLNRW